MNNEQQPWRRPMYSSSQTFRIVFVTVKHVINEIVLMRAATKGSVTIVGLSPTVPVVTGSV